MTKAELLTMYLNSEVSASELTAMSLQHFGVLAATKDELTSFLNNRFTQSIMSDTYGISVDTLISKVNELLMYI